MSTDFATSAGHWYKRDGTPCYEIESAKGTMRPVTLRDCRKLDLVPSVTSVLRELAAPGLEQWKQRNILMAALTLPKYDGESLDDYAVRCIRDAGEQSKKAMQTGTDIHGEIEKVFLGKVIKSPTPIEEKAQNVWGYVAEHFGATGWSAERSFASPVGYGGKIDLSGNSIVIDFKTKPVVEEGQKYAYPEMCYQLAAYATPLQCHRCVNIFVGVENNGITHYEWTREEIATGYEIFLNTLAIWKLKRGLK